LIPAVLRKEPGIRIGDKVNLIVEKDRIKIVPLKNKQVLKNEQRCFINMQKESHL
jgi:bifunctional DNA-binding transcriptional regulator/antitoxin component of YhaV-PrlF toxin-antitoxin module